MIVFAEIEFQKSQVAWLFAVAVGAGLFRAGRYKIDGIGDKTRFAICAFTGGVIGTCGSVVLADQLGKHGWQNGFPVQLMIAMLLGFLGIVLFDAVASPIERIAKLASTRIEDWVKARLESWFPKPVDNTSKPAEPVPQTPSDGGKK